MRREHIESGLIFTQQRVPCMEEKGQLWRIRIMAVIWSKMSKDGEKWPDRELHLGLLNSLTSLSWGEIFGHGTVFCICTSFGIFLVGLTIFCRWALLGASCPCVSVCQLNCSTVKSVVGLNSRPDKRLRQQNNFARAPNLIMTYPGVSWWLCHCIEMIIVEKPSRLCTKLENELSSLQKQIFNN